MVSKIYIKVVLMECMKKEIMLTFGVVLMLLMLRGVTAVDLTVNFPRNGEIYSSRSLNVDLEADEESDFFYLKDRFDIFGNWRKLCLR